MKTNDKENTNSRYNRLQDEWRILFTPNEQIVFDHILFKSNLSGYQKFHCATVGHNCNIDKGVVSRLFKKWNTIFFKFGDNAYNSHFAFDYAAFLRFVLNKMKELETNNKNKDVAINNDSGSNSVTVAINNDPVANDNDIVAINNKVVAINNDPVANDNIEVRIEVKEENMNRNNITSNIEKPDLLMEISRSYENLFDSASKSPAADIDTLNKRSIVSGSVIISKSPAADIDMDSSNLNESVCDPSKDNIALLFSKNMIYVAEAFSEARSEIYKKKHLHDKKAVINELYIKVKVLQCSNSIEAKKQVNQIKDQVIDDSISNFLLN